MVGEVLHEGGLAGLVELGKDVVEKDEWGAVALLKVEVAFDEFEGDDDGAVFALAGDIGGETIVEAEKEIVPVRAKAGGTEELVALVVGTKSIEILFFAAGFAGITKLDAGAMIREALIVAAGDFAVNFG